MNRVNTTSVWLLHRITKICTRHGPGHTQGQPRRVPPIHGVLDTSTELVPYPRSLCPNHRVCAPSTGSVPHPRRLCPIHDSCAPSTIHGACAPSTEHEFPLDPFPKDHPTPHASEPKPTVQSCGLAVLPNHCHFSTYELWNYDQ